ncbi:protease inhibitor I42 family protein [Streptomyces sp. NPDC051243]|uniref:protease inhibitor I42 family protein n=1 Tax=Streptomyces sp. NPDC051243 TaxID=3365646 RepID=UPI003799D51D
MITYSPRATARRRTAVVALVPSLLSLLFALTACGVFGTSEYGTKERTITVEAGEAFTLTVPANPNMGQNWYLAEPRPDSEVLRYEGKREEIEGTDEGVSGGGDGTQYFDFTAVASGKATVKLLHCPLGSCGSAAEAEATPVPIPTATGPTGPGADPAYFLYEVTVR